MEILFHVLTYDFDLALRSFFELVEGQVRVVTTEVVKEHRDSKTDRALQVALTVSGAEKEFSDVIVITDLRHFRIVLFVRVAANLAMRRVFVFRPLLGVHSFHRSINLKLLNDGFFPAMRTFINSVRAIFPTFITVN